MRAGSHSSSTRVHGLSAGIVTGGEVAVGSGLEPVRADPSLIEAVRSAALASGCEAVGFATAEPFAETRRMLEDRKADGLHGGMAFTYRNPARSTDPGRSLPSARSLVVGARGYRRDLGEGGERAAAIDDRGGAKRRGRVARYSWTDHYTPLRTALQAAADVLEAAGWQARVLVDDNALVDRAAAHRAGLGWYGKNANLLLPGVGSWFVLGSVVTDAPLVDQPVVPLTTDDGCGSCTRCLPACPTGALVAPGVLDARRCLAWLVEAPGVFPTEHREALGDRIYGCDDCQEVCPPNRLDERRRPVAKLEADAEPWVDLVELLALEDDRLLERYGRWYIPGRDPAALRRNALLALGNVGDARDPAVRAAIDVALRDGRELVRAHAVWAARRLGLAELVREVGADRDPSALVRAELDSVVATRMFDRRPADGATGRAP